MKIFILFFSLILICFNPNAYSNCRRKVAVPLPKVKDIPALSKNICLSTLHSKECINVYTKIKNAGESVGDRALRCDGDKPPVVTGVEWIKGCSSGGWEFLKNLIVPIGTSIGEGLASIVVSREEFERWNNKCSQSKLSKMAIYEEYNNAVPELMRVNPMDSKTLNMMSCEAIKNDLDQKRMKLQPKLDKLRMLSLNKNNKFEGAEKEYVDFIHRGDVGINQKSKTTLLDEAKKYLAEKGIELGCYNEEYRAAMLCEAVAEVVSLLVPPAGVARISKVSKLAGMGRSERAIISTAEEFAAASKLTMPERIKAAEELVGHKLSDAQLQALEKAHNVGAERGFGNYTREDKMKKGLALMRGGFSRKEAELLLDRGIAGSIGKEQSTIYKIVTDHFSNVVGRSLDDAQKDAIMEIHRVQMTNGLPLRDPKIVLRESKFSDREIERILQAKKAEEERQAQKMDQWLADKKAGTGPTPAKPVAASPATSTVQAATKPAETTPSLHLSSGSNQPSSNVVAGRSAQSASPSITETKTSVTAAKEAEAAKVAAAKEAEAAKVAAAKEAEAAKVAAAKEAEAAKVAAAKEAQALKEEKLKSFYDLNTSNLAKLKALESETDYAKKVSVLDQSIAEMEAAVANARKLENLTSDEKFKLNQIISEMTSRITAKKVERDSAMKVAKALQDKAPVMSEINANKAAIEENSRLALSETRYEERLKLHEDTLKNVEDTIAKMKAQKLAETKMLELLPVSEKTKAYEALKAKGALNADEIKILEAKKQALSDSLKAMKEDKVYSATLLKEPATYSELKQFLPELKGTSVGSVARDAKQVLESDITAFLAGRGTNGRISTLISSVEKSGGRVTKDNIRQLIEAAKKLPTAEIETFEKARSKAAYDSLVRIYGSQTNIDIGTTIKSASEKISSARSELSKIKDPSKISEAETKIKIELEKCHKILDLYIQAGAFSDSWIGTYKRQVRDMCK